MIEEPHSAKAQLHLRGRRTFVAGAVTVLAAPLAAAAQQARRVYRIGWMTTGPIAFIANFREGMHELGYVDGQNLVIEERYGPPVRLTEIAEELARLKADLI